MRRPCSPKWTYPSGRQSPLLDLSIVVPTFNEVDKVPELLKRLDRVLCDLKRDMVFVDDDSPDGTAETVRQFARSDTRARCVQRIGRRGLSSACVEGMLASSAPVLCVMDADLQHDESRIAAMFALLRTDERVDIVVATRYAEGGSVGAWDDAKRYAMSRIATRMSRIVCRQEVLDPMSGFFMIRRGVLDGSVRRLSAIGFKILLDIRASSTKRLVMREVPFTFRQRIAGESKLDSIVAWDFAMLLADRTVGRFIPVRFVSFIFVGDLGVLVQMTVVFLLLRVAGVLFQTSQTVAAVTAMVFNYFLNNVLTYRDQRLRGWRWWRGLELCGHHGVYMDQAAEPALDKKADAG
jgi:dolichol-phosphate mannosyltransferase